MSAAPRDHLTQYAIFSNKYTRVQYRNVEEGFLRWGYKTNEFILDNRNEVYNIEINSATKINAMILDIDTPELYNPSQEMPTIITKNKADDKRHELFYLSAPYFIVNNDLKKAYNQNKKKLYTRTNADIKFKNRTTKNFLNNFYDVDYTGELLHSIFDVSKIIYPSNEINSPKSAKNESYADKWTPNDYISATANGMSLFSAYFFDTVRDNIQLRNNSESAAFKKAMETQADIIIQTIQDDGFALTPTLAMPIIERIIQESEKSHRAFIQRQSDKAKISNLKRWGSQSDTEQRIINAYKELQGESLKTTVTALSNRVGLSRMQLNRNYKELISELKTSGA